MNSISTIVGFTFKNRFRSKPFMITSVLLAIVLTVLINLPYIIQLFVSEEDASVAMPETELSKEIKQRLEEAGESGLQVVLLPDPDPEAVKERIRDGEFDGYLEIGDVTEHGFPQMIYYSEKDPDRDVISRLQNTLEQMKTDRVVKEIGLSQEELARLNAPVVLEQQRIADGGTNGETGEPESPGEKVVAYVLVYVLLIMIFMVVTMYGNMIAMEITAEKSSRVMEILISSVSPLKQMFGKILGMFLLALTQISAYMIIIAANLLLPHNREILKKLDLSLADVDLSLLAYFVLFYLLGYLLYSTVFAAIGSLVSRTEDLGQALTPMTFLTLAGFYIGLFGINMPDSMFVKVSSFIPFFTPFIMFLRVGLSDPAWWEIALSVLLLAVSILAMGWLAAKIYRTGVLLYGKRPGIRELRKAMKAYKV